MDTEKKPVMMVAVDESKYSYYALEWTIDHFFAPFPGTAPFKLVIIHAKPSPTVTIGIAAPDVLAYVDGDLKKIAAGVVERSHEICSSRSVEDVTVEVVEGDARNVICEAVDKHHASILVVGSHSYGIIKRAVLGSVSDYCAHHAHCNVLIVKKPKTTE